MPKPFDGNTKANVRVLLYGESGSGKTSWIVQASKTFQKPVYVMNFDPEDNLRMIAAQKGANQNLLYDQYMPIIEGDKSRGYEAFLEQLIKLKKIPVEEFPMALVAVENGNELHKCILKYTADLKGHEQPTLPDYGLAHDRFKQRLRELNELPCHTVVTFHQQIERDEVQGMLVGRILLGGKTLPDEIPPMFNMFLRCKVLPKPGAKPEYKVITTKEDLFPAADKTGVLDPTEPNDFKIIWAKITSKLSIQ